MESFDEFFRRATGRSPYGYQARLAAAGLPAEVHAPTGTGKTAIMLAWLWRRLYGPAPALTPPRLIYALPQRSLVEQVAADARQWLTSLGLTDQVALHVVMGGSDATGWQWRQDPHAPAILIGTVDSLVSKALNRGFGIDRVLYPIDFALVTNGAHWVIDESELCPQSTATLRTIAELATALRTAEPLALTRMSALPARTLAAAGSPAPDARDREVIEPAERTGELAARLDARRTVRRLAAEPGAYRAIGRAAAERHRPGTVTLVVLNSVEAARLVHAAVPAGAARCTLIHSRFRGQERRALAALVTGPPGQAGHIVIATQVAEAGLDISAALLVTEAASWPSIVLRAGKCNRAGTHDGAELLWVPPAGYPPYEERDVAASIAELQALEGQNVTAEDLLRRAVAVTEPAVAALPEADVLALFDTAGVHSGADLDVTPYVRDADDPDAQLSWAHWTPEPAESTQPAGDGRPPSDLRLPPGEWRCRAPLSEVAALAARVPAWRHDRAGRGWVVVTPGEGPRPGELLLVAASDGGYDPVTGFDPMARGPVSDCPTLSSRAELAAREAEAARDSSGAVPAGEPRGQWQSLQRHSDETRDHAAALISVIGPGISPAGAQAVVAAAYLHDTGKAHPIWQDALCALAAADDQDRIDAGRPWAKSGGDGRLIFAGDVQFRHEFASLLLIDGPLSSLLAGVADRDLARYLVLAHHGKLRVRVVQPGQASPAELLGLPHGSAWPVPSILGQAATTLTVRLDQFSGAGAQSWTETVHSLRDRYGPFVLAYLETLVRIADWRASAGLALAR